MELQLVPLSKSDPDIDAVRELYESAFPENERGSFSALFLDFQGAEELLAAREGELLAGLIVMLTLEDISHILYFAVMPELRGGGYGSRILKLVRERYSGQRIIADLELPEDGVNNEPERERRIVFYEKNGYCRTEIVYRWEGEDYCIMSNGGNVTEKEFSNFWRYFYSRGQSDSI